MPICVEQCFLSVMWEVSNLIVLTAVAFIMAVVVFITKTINVKLKVILHCLEQEVNARDLLTRKMHKTERIERGNAENKIQKTRKPKETKATEEIRRETPPEKDIHLYEDQLLPILKQLAPFLDDFARHPEQYNVCPSQCLFLK